LNEHAQLKDRLVDRGKARNQQLELTRGMRRLIDLERKSKESTT
jgi:hypothetical protein